MVQQTVIHPRRDTQGGVFRVPATGCHALHQAQRIDIPPAFGDLGGMGPVDGRAVCLQIEDEKVITAAGFADAHHIGPGFRRLVHQRQVLLAQLIRFGGGQQQTTGIGGLYRDRALVFFRDGL